MGVQEPTQSRSPKDGISLLLDSTLLSHPLGGFHSHFIHGDPVSLEFCCEQGCVTSSADSSHGLIIHFLVTSVSHLPVLENRNLKLNEISFLTALMGYEGI